MPTSLPPLSYSFPSPRPSPKRICFLTFRLRRPCFLPYHTVFHVVPGPVPLLVFRKHVRQFLRHTLEPPAPSVLTTWTSRRDLYPYLPPYALHTSFSEQVPVLAVDLGREYCSDDEKNHVFWAKKETHSYLFHGRVKRQGHVTNSYDSMWGCRHVLDKERTHHYLRYVTQHFPQWVNPLILFCISNGNCRVSDYLRYPYICPRVRFWIVLVQYLSIC